MKEEVLSNVVKELQETNYQEDAYISFWSNLDIYFTIIYYRFNHNL